MTQCRGSKKADGYISSDEERLEKSVNGAESDSSDSHTSELHYDLTTFVITFFFKYSQSLKPFKAKPQSKDKQS